MSRGAFGGRFDRYYRKTFGEAAAKYLYDAERVRKIKHPNRLAYCVYNLSLYIAKEPLIDIDEAAISQYKEDRGAGKGRFKDRQPAAAGTINKEMRTLRAILNYACEVERWIPGVPKIRDVKGPVKVAHPLSLIEKNRIFDALPEHWRNGAAKFALYTGVRKAELTGLRWEHMVPFQEGIDYVSRPDGVCVLQRRYVFALPTTKNAKQRAVICNSRASEAVEYQKKLQANYPSPWVFPSRRGQRIGERLQNVDVIWRKAWKDAGMPSDPLVLKGWNTLRHTYASWLLACGVIDELRDKLMGHHQADIRYNYSQHALEALFEAAENITDDDRIGRSTILRAVPVAA